MSDVNLPPPGNNEAAWHPHPDGAPGHGRWWTGTEWHVKEGWYWGGAWQDHPQPPPQPKKRGPYYDTSVNKGSVNMNSLAKYLNQRSENGWRLHSIFEQAGNTVMIFESIE